VWWTAEVEQVECRCGHARPHAEHLEPRLSAAAAAVPVDARPAADRAAEHEGQIGGGEAVWTEAEQRETTQNRHVFHFASSRHTSLR